MALLRQAEVHGVLPLVAHHLEQLGDLHLPQDVAALFQRQASLHAGRSLLLARELRDVLEQLMAAGIPVIPLKGVALAHALYGRCTLRVSGDIDILVRRAQVPDAVSVLEAKGYRAEGPWRRWSRAAYHIEIPLLPRGAGRRWALDLHWGLVGGEPRYRRAAEECWEAARIASVVGVEAWAMSPEWELLFLALHAARSQWQGLKWLVDIQQICWTWRLDWQIVWAMAHRWGWGEILQLTLEACRRLWELPPTGGPGSIAWPSWIPRYPDPPRQTRWSGFRVMCRLLPGWRQRIAYALRLVGTPSPSDYRWFPLPAFLSPLYLFLRPFRWAVMAVRGRLDKIGPQVS